MAITVVCPGDHQGKHPPQAELQIRRDQEDDHWKIDPPAGWRLIEVRRSGTAAGHELFAVCGPHCEWSVLSKLSQAALDEAQADERKR